MTDSAVADHAAPDRPNRRALFGAGVIGAALALAGSHTVSAAAIPGLSDDDTALAAFAIGLELGARDLYDAAIAAGATGEAWQFLRENHESYAQRLAGIAGLKANRRSDDVFDSMVARFQSGTAEAALELENLMAATNTELIGAMVDPLAASALASMVAIESRHAVLVAGIGGVTDFDTLFRNTATPLAPEA